MTVKVGVKITGQRDIEANLKILREHYHVRTGGVIMRGLRAGATVIRNEARRLAPVLDSENARARFKQRRFHKAGVALSKAEQGRVPLNLKSNIVTQMVSARKNNGVPGVWVRVRTKRGYILDWKGNYLANLVNNPLYWWFLEFGTSKMRGYRFLRGAFESKKQAAAQRVFEHTKKQIGDLFAKFQKTGR